jgi:endonuclease/exonuclease/phosphatase family metal-dependent hydrolase
MVTFARIAGIAAVMGLCCGAIGQLRVATYNISNYGGGLMPELRTAFYGTFSGRQLAPDVVLLQEFTAAVSVSDFVTALNTAPGSPGDWAAAAFVNGADTDAAFAYRTSKVSYLGYTIVSTGSSSTSNHPRNLMRYDIRPIGYAAASTRVYLYNTHMKAGTTQTDLDRRLIEAQRFRTSAESLSAGSNFVLGGDFNIVNASEAAYQHLVSSQINNAGRVFDPINRPASWNSATYQFIHTQDPAGSGGMDDRYDQLLISSALFDGQGVDYIGNPAIPFNLTTWNDSNHSYRCWGNDGTSYNGNLRTNGNTMVGPTIALALIALADGAGHLPVYSDFRIPAKIAAPTSIKFGSIPQGMKPVARTLNIGHAGNVSLWSAAGLQPLNYSMTIPSGFTGPSGPFTLGPSASNLHTIVMDTRTPGHKTATLTIASNDPDFPVKTVTLQGYVIPRSGHGTMP